MFFIHIIDIDIIDDLAFVWNLILVNVVVTFVSIAPSKDIKQILLNDFKGQNLASTEDQRILIFVSPVIFWFGSRIKYGKKFLEFLKSPVELLDKTHLT